MMNWSNLRENKCPKCNKVIDPEIKFGMFRCSMCTFAISPKRYQEIVESRDRWQPRFNINNKHWRPKDEEQE